MRDPDEITTELEEAVEAAHEGSRVAMLTYEEGVVAALAWVLEHPGADRPMAD